jgi:NMD protein affecting ribosome stability and mRNA decay
MYCVICGRGLDLSNHVGIVCLVCHRARAANKRLQGTLVVNYCHVCGGLYSPGDASIRHASCTPGYLKTSPWIPATRGERGEA